MSIEIERKFRPVQVPPAELLGVGRSMRQGYLAEEGGTAVRIRISEDEATLTIKAGSGLARTEVELDVPADEVAALWELTAGRRIAKIRHRVSLATARDDGSGPLVAEVDIYDLELAGLCTVEVEFGDVDEARAFEPPAWFGEELTGVPGWSNADLARRGRPD